MVFRKDIYNKLDKEDKKAYATSYDKPLRKMRMVKPSDDINSPNSSTPDRALSYGDAISKAMEMDQTKQALRNKVKKKGAK